MGGAMSWRESNTPRLSALAVAEVISPIRPAGSGIYTRSAAISQHADDLAVILETLTHLDDLPRAEREARRQEYKELEKALLSEIGESAVPIERRITQALLSARPESCRAAAFIAICTERSMRHGKIVQTSQQPDHRTGGALRACFVASAQPWQTGERWQTAKAKP